MSRDKNGNPTEFTKGVIYAKEIMECTIIGLQNKIGITSDPKYTVLDEVMLAVNKQLENDIK